MISTALLARHTERPAVTVRSVNGVDIVTAEPKGAAVSLRQQLVRRGIICTFPVPTWERGKYEFHAKRPAGMTRLHLEELINSLTDAECRESREINVD